MWASLSKLKHMGHTKSLSLSSRDGETPDNKGRFELNPGGYERLRLLPLDPEEDAILMEFT